MSRLLVAQCYWYHWEPRLHASQDTRRSEIQPRIGCRGKVVDAPTWFRNYKVTATKALLLLNI
jgi:hypothetical protein